MWSLYLIFRAVVIQIFYHNNWKDSYPIFYLFPDLSLKSTKKKKKKTLKCGGLVFEGKGIKQMFIELFLKINLIVISNVFTNILEEKDWQATHIILEWNTSPLGNSCW